MTRQKTAADRRTKLVQVRVSEAELAAIDDAAKRAGLDRSSYMRYASLMDSSHSRRDDMAKKPKPKGKPPKGC